MIEVKISEVTTVLRGEMANVKTENDTAIITVQNKMEVQGQSLQKLGEAGRYLQYLRSWLSVKQH